MPSYYEIIAVLFRTTLSVALQRRHDNISCVFKYFVKLALMVAAFLALMGVS